MSELETLLSASVDLARLRKLLETANSTLEQAYDRITDLQHENGRLKTQLLAKDMIIQALKDQLDAQTPALLRPQI